MRFVPTPDQLISALKVEFAPSLYGDPGMPPAHKGYPDAAPAAAQALGITTPPMTPEQYEVRGGPVQRNCIPPGPPDKAIGASEDPEEFRKQFVAAFDDLLKRFGLGRSQNTWFYHTETPGLEQGTVIRIYTGRNYGREI